MEALVRVRALVSPSFRLTYGEPAVMAICSVSSPAGLLAEPGELAEHQRAPRMSARASASSSVSGMSDWQASGSSGS